MAPVARALASTQGVLEPWQSARTVAGEVDELAGQVAAWSAPPVILVGHSWGAWLSLLVAAEHPQLLRRVVLVGSGPLRAKYAREIRRRRQERLGPERWREFEKVERRLSDPKSRPASTALRRLGELSEASDSYSLLPRSSVQVPVNADVFRAVWGEAEEMRRSGALARALHRVRVPVTVLHGAEDPHPLEGVVEPLRKAGRNPHVIVLPRCGHEPWRERYARRPLFEALRRELALS